MSGPPKDADAVDVWLKVSQRPRPFKVIDFPSKDGEFGQVALWILTESERRAVLSAAQKVAKQFCGPESKAGDIGYEEIFQDEAAFQLVCIACRKVGEMNEPAFVHPQLARTKITTDEIAILVRAYNAFRVEAGPMLSELTKDEMEAWIAKLQEGSSRLPLSRLTGEALIDLVLYLVSKLPISSTDTGSAGSPPEEDFGTLPTGSDLVDPSELPKPE